MAEPREAEGKGRERTGRSPDQEQNSRVLSDSKLGAAQEGDPAGKSEEQALSDSKLGSDDDGGLKGQGGMRDPAKTSDAGKLKPR